MSQEQQNKAMEPEGTVRVGRGGLVEDAEQDAEGHALRGGRPLTEDTGADPEAGIRLPQSQEDADGKPGDPDESRMGVSDRNLKVAILPVTW